MKNLLTAGIAVICISLALYSCQNGEKNEKSNGQVITEKIEYPVFIKDPYELDNGEWWKENIETSKRLEFIKILFDWAYSGDVKAYDYLTNKELTLEEVKQIGNKTDTIRIADINPPYEEKDTTIQNKLDFNLIHKIKFMEEWSINIQNHSIDKRIIGVAPSLTIYGDSTEIKGYKPLFWLYFDKEYVKNLKRKE
jgi:hypothetical protein